VIDWSATTWLDDIARGLRQTFDSLATTLAALPFEAPFAKLDEEHARYVAHGEMLLLRATRPHPERDPRRREHRPRPIRASARRVRRRWRKPSGRTAPVTPRGRARCRASGRDGG
jgi:hypothetical protein